MAMSRNNMIFNIYKQIEFFIREIETNPIRIINVPH